MRPVTPFLGLIALAAFGCAEPYPMTYERYVEEGGADYHFDPVGASNIYVGGEQTRDGYEIWWRFDISARDFELLTRAICKTHKGPDPPDLRTHGAYPKTWRLSEAHPDWWRLPIQGRLQSVSWCYPTDDTNAERHHGWYLLFDGDAGAAWIWHWNHQWSSQECQPNAA